MYTEKLKFITKKAKDELPYSQTRLQKTATRTKLTTTLIIRSSWDGKIFTAS